MKLYDLSKLSVLIVDDNKFMRTTIFQLLYGLGVRNTMQAPDAQTATMYLSDAACDLMVLDWDLGKGKGGVDLVKEVRAGADSRNTLVPIIMLTAYSSRKNVEVARDAGVTEFCAKPASALALYEKIVSIIENPRQFVKTPTYFGPDRRRKADETYKGPKRRAEDQEE